MRELTFFLLIFKENRYIIGKMLKILNNFLTTYKSHLIESVLLCIYTYLYMSKFSRQFPNHVYM